MLDSEGTVFEKGDRLAPAGERDKPLLECIRIEKDTAVLKWLPCQVNDQELTIDQKNLSSSAWVKYVSEEAEK